MRLALAPPCAVLVFGHAGKHANHKTWYRQAPRGPQITTWRSGGGWGGVQPPTPFANSAATQKDTINIGHPEEVPCLNIRRYSSGGVVGGGGGLPPLCKYWACVADFRDCACEILRGGVGGGSAAPTPANMQQHRKIP